MLVCPESPLRVYIFMNRLFLPGRQVPGGGQDLRTASTTARSAQEILSSSFSERTVLRHLGQVKAGQREAAQR
jgi:hypothetical protein